MVTTSSAGILGEEINQKKSPVCEFDGSISECQQICNQTTNKLIKW